MQDDQQDAVDMLMAEVDVYQLFFFKHCKGRRVQLALCEEFKERMNDVKSELASYDAESQDDNNRAKASVALKRIDEWNLFSDSSEVLIVIFVWLKISMQDNAIF
jgi:hypothetical protein